MKSKKRWAAIAADTRDHPLVGMQVAPPRPADAGRHAQAPYVAWLDMIFSAAHAPHDARANGQVIKLHRGEFLAGRAYWANRWNWGEQAVRGFFTRLERAEMITFLNQNTNHGVTVAKISKYGDYQNEPKAKQPRDQPSSNQSATSDQPYITRIQEDKEIPPTPKGADLRSDVADAFAAYNAVAERLALPVATKLTADRQRKIKARLDDYGLDGWNKALDQIGLSAFLTGKTSHCFRADLEFICRPTSFAKLHDGGYLDRRRPVVLTDEVGAPAFARYA